MIAKLKLVSTYSHNHPMYDSDRIDNKIGYIRDMPTISNPLILWYYDERDKESKYLRTSAVKSLSYQKDHTLVETQNSTYLLEIMPVKFQFEEKL